MMGGLGSQKKLTTPDLVLFPHSAHFTSLRQSLSTHPLPVRITVLFLPAYPVRQEVNTHT
ncbi:MAG: hypothetical protein NPIRA06_22170 [Nitrospirales bacterium]|nr:MAG: hypothetical protein NPIRA06_22170 [Nitrospirales bacterium]